MYNNKVITYKHKEKKEAFILLIMLCVETAHSLYHPPKHTNGKKNGINPTSKNNAMGVNNALHNPNVISVGCESLYFQICSRFLNTKFI